MRYKSVVTATLILAVTVLAVDGQERQQRERIRATGKVKGMRNGILQVVGEDGDQWWVKVEARRPEDVSFTGSAAPSWLVPGMIVEFKGQFSKRGKALAPVRSLRVVTPTEEKPIGVEAATNVGGSGASELFSSGEKKKKSRKRSNSPSYRVIGTLRSIKNGKMVVAAGRTVVQAELDKAAKVSVEVADGRFARVGDSIEFDGWHNAGDVTRVVANRVSISAAQTLGEDPSAAKKRPDRRKRTRSSKKKQ